MTNLTELQNLVDRFHANIEFYKDARNAYNALSEGAKAKVPQSALDKRAAAEAAL